MFLWFELCYIAKLIIIGMWFLGPALWMCFLLFVSHLDLCSEQWFAALMLWIILGWGEQLAICLARVVWVWPTWVLLCGHNSLQWCCCFGARSPWQRGKAALLWREPESTVTSSRGLSHSYWDYSYTVGVPKDWVRQWTRMDIPSILPVLPPSLLQKKSWCRCLYPVSFFPHCICLSSLAAVEGNLARDADSLPCLWDGRFLKYSNLAKRIARKTEGRGLRKAWRGLNPSGFEEG